MTFGSLFAGIGGIDLGLERAGWECKWQVEIDAYATQVLAKHWPQVIRWDDVCTFPPAGSWDVDLIAAGFPCQDISTSGKKEGVHGSRSGLFFEVIRIAELLRPSLVLLETTTALTYAGAGYGTVLGALAEIGYDCEWHCLPVAGFGAPHIRDRIFIIAKYRQGVERHETEVYCIQCGLPVFSGCGCEHGEWQCRDCGEWTYPWHYSRADGCQTCGSTNVADAYGKRGRSGYAGRQHAAYVRQPPGSSWGRWWRVEPDVGRVAHGIPRRVDRLRGLGNAVVPQVAEVLGRAIAGAYKIERDG